MQKKQEESGKALPLALKDSRRRASLTKTLDPDPDLDLDLSSKKK